MNKRFKVILAIFSISIIFVVSEIVYIISSPLFVSDYYFGKAKNEALKGDSQRALFVLHKGVRSLKILQNKQKLSAFLKLNYSNESEIPDPILPQYEDMTYLPAKNINLQRDVHYYFKDLDFASLSPDYRYTISRVYYDLGILAIRNNEPFLFPRYLKNSIDLDPRNHFWYLELSNFYTRYGQKKEAKDLLARCVEFADEPTWCAEYLVQIGTRESTPEPGFLLIDTGNYYRYPSLLITSSNL